MSNLNEIRSKQVTVNIAGEELPLKYTLNAFAELEDSYGSIDKALEAVDKGSIKALRKVLWAGLLHAKPSITECEVGSAIDISTIVDLASTLGDAITLALPPDEAKPVAAK